MATRWVGEMRRGIFLILAAFWVGHNAAPAHADATLTPATLPAESVQSAGPFTIDLAAAEHPPALCPPAGDAVVADTPLTMVRQAMQPGERLDILVVGSATVLGPDGNQPQDGFPFRMAEMLKATAPQTDVTITFRGGKGVTVETMRTALMAALAAHPYQLILWQTGTVEAVRGLPPEALYNTIAEEAAGLRDKTDLILIDPQFSRLLRANTNITPYENALERVAAMPGVTLFHRFELMRTWADRGTIDLEHAAPSERKSTNMHLHACLGRALARMVLAGAGLHAAK